MMNKRTKELAEHAGAKFFNTLGAWMLGDEELERFAELVEQWARADESKVIDGILDQALKDQKDAERYTHLKWVITSKSIEEWLLIDKTDAQIDALMDERIRSYDE